MLFFTGIRPSVRVPPRCTSSPVGRCLRATRCTSWSKSLRVTESREQQLSGSLLLARVSTHATPGRGGIIGQENAGYNIPTRNRQHNLPTHRCAKSRPRRVLNSSLLCHAHNLSLCMRCPRPGRCPLVDIACVASQENVWACLHRNVRPCDLNLDLVDNKTWWEELLHFFYSTKRKPQDDRINSDIRSGLLGKCTTTSDAMHGIECCPIVVRLEFHRITAFRTTTTVHK